MLTILLAVKDLVWKIIPRKLVDKFVSIYFNRKKFKKQDWMMLHLSATGRCNLNCVGCSAFAPIAGDYVLDTVSFEADCKRLLELCVGRVVGGMSGSVGVGVGEYGEGCGGGIIPEIHIVGGEPLLHPKLNEIIVIAHRYFPQAKLKIVSNGILLLKQKEDFWACCEQNKVDIIISHYPITLDIKSIRRKAKAHKIELRYYRGVLPWYKMEFDLAGGYDAEKNFRKCNAALQCIELCEGKIATCQYILKMSYFKDYFHKDIEVHETDFIDIYKAKSIDEILEFISKPVPFCRYCTLKYLPVKWGPSKKDISEWT